MGFSTQQLARLSELLDHSLPLTTDARRTWLESLSAEDQPLVQALRESLLAEDPEAGGLRALAQLPSGTTQRRAGERLGAYELLRPIGAGGMAEVWLARRADGVFERQVALKIPLMNAVPLEMTERFARECRILATLESPGIARLYDAGIHDGTTPYFAMEYVQGEDLIGWCDSRRLDTDARVRLFIQVLEAVGHAHALGIIHRDLKPSNILVTATGEVRLLDFGVASLLQAETNQRSLTRIYGRALTPAYASPELLRDEDIDVRSDIYSLGAVLQELLTGRRPGPGAPPVPGATPVSSGLQSVLKTALSPDPAQRYPDVASFAAALKQQHASGARNFSGRYLWSAVVLALAVIAGIVAIDQELKPAGSDVTAAAAPATAPDVSVAIAVLPFVDLSEQHDKGYLSDGLAVELIDLLTKVPELRVTARASSFAFRDRKVEISAIGRQLNVSHILEGSVRTSGSRLKFTVQLVRTDDDTTIWSESYDRELKDVFEIQEDVAASVVDALKLRLQIRLAGENAMPSIRRTTNLRAYEEYLLGRQYRDGISLERWQHAQAAFQRAVALDPGFAPAHAGIALTAAELGAMTMQNASYDLAVAEAERTMALAPHLAEAYVARAYVRMNRDWEYEGARVDLEFAARLDPNNLELMQAQAIYLWETAQIAEALEIQRRITVARNPLSSKAWDWLAVIFMGSRDYAAARDALRRSAELSPYSDYRLLLMTRVELYAGNVEEALRTARANPDPNWHDYTVAMAAHSAGHPAEAREALQRLITRAPDFYAAQIANIYAWQRNADESFRWLERAISLRDPGLAGIQTAPEFEAYRQDPRFKRALRLMKLKP